MIIQISFEKSSTCQHMFLTVLCNSLKIIKFSTTTSMSHSILFLSNSPSFLSVLDTMIIHWNLNMLLNELRCALGQWSMQCIAASLHFLPFMMRQLWCHLHQENIIGLENGLEIAWNYFFQFSLISFLFYSFLLLEFQDIVLKKVKSEGKKGKIRQLSCLRLMMFCWWLRRRRSA